MYSCFMQGMTNITVPQFLPSVYNTNRFNFPFFPQLVITVALLFEMRSPLQSFFFLSLYAVQDRHTEMSHLYYVSMYRLTTGFLHLLLYFIQINTAQSSAV